MDLRPRGLPRIGIVGGGQLAKMTAQAAHPLGCSVRVLERQPEFPADLCDTDTVLGDWDDPAVLGVLATDVDVVTLENELVDAGALEAVAARGALVLPSPATIHVTPDKLLQKRRLAAAGLPVPAFRDAPTRAALDAAAADLGLPVVVKRRRGGYDGRGNATARDAAGLDRAWERLGADARGLYVEVFVPFVAEAAAIVVRGRDGGVVSYPVVETVNADHVCREVVAPGRFDPALAARAADVARAAVAAVDGVGAFGVEMFVGRDGEVLVNELAPRVHNTGHYTIEGCTCSQFENHLRAVLGWPLGSTAMRAPAAAMVNLLGAGPGTGEPHGLARALAVEGAHVHVYGKTRSERGRKMGHVTALGATPEAALATAREAAGRIRFGEAT